MTVILNIVIEVLREKIPGGSGELGIDIGYLFANFLHLGNFDLRHCCFQITGSNGNPGRVHLVTSF